MAIFPAGQTDIPDEVTPEYVARQPLVLEHPRGAVHALVTQWLSKHLPLQRTPMHIGTVDAMKRVVASNLGMSIVPDVAVVEPTPDLIVRSLKPKLPCTLALIEHRNKPKEPAFDIVRAALLELRTLGANASDDRARREKRAEPLSPLGRMRKSKRSAHAL